MRKLIQAVLMTAAFGLLVFSANSAMAQGRGHYRQERKQAHREYRRDVRKDRREYRREVRGIRNNRRYPNYETRYYRVRPRGHAYGYYNNRTRVRTGNRYYYRNGRLYRRW